MLWLALTRREGVAKDTAIEFALRGVACARVKVTVAVA